jgi:copper chaperone CopZ
MTELTEEIAMTGTSTVTTAVYAVTGMTCAHCVQAVSSEIGALAGVREVRVELTAGEVTVVSEGPLALDAVRAAVDEAGYQLAG